MKLENRSAAAAAGTLVDDKNDKASSSRKDRSLNKVGEIDVADLFEPSSAKNEASQKASHFKDVCTQMLNDNLRRPKVSVALQVIARIFGQTLARCLSNMMAYFTGQPWLEARRDYAVLPNDAKIMNSKGEVIKVGDLELTAASLAERYKPKLYTISEDQSVDESAQGAEIRYEVLPPRQGKSSYSIIYYVRREREHMPIPFLGLGLELLRPIFWATKSEWNAIEIDIDRDKGEPESINYESSNYSGNPLSYDITSTNDVHLPAKAVLRDKKWSHTLSQKDGRAKTRDLENPFACDPRPSFVFVNWNGDLDLASATRLAGYQLEGDATNKTRLYKMKDLPIGFLDIDTYRKEALDLRNTWLKRRQTGHCYLYFPPRKDASQFKVINLLSAELPSLMQRAA